jgi:hypothetical protein
VVALALCLGVIGCGGGAGLTRANFDRIKIDGSMTQEDVDKLLGSKGTDLTGALAKQFTAAFEKAGKDVPDLGKGLPDLGKGFPDLGKGLPDLGKGLPDLGKMFGAFMPKAVRWGDDSKYIVCVIMGGKVAGKDQKGL